jgi:hypothetical protein
MKSARSVFRTDIRDGMLAPGEGVTVTLTANLDDTILHKDSFNVIVQEGTNIVVPVTAKGTGTTLYCADEIKKIDFGFKFGGVQCEKRYLVENRGRRPQMITWVNKTKAEQDEEAHHAYVQKLKDIKQAEIKSGKKKSKKKPPPEPEPVPAVFTVEPEEVELKPSTACWFSVYGNSAELSQFEETLVCESRVGKEKNARPALTCVSSATFIHPRLQPSVESLEYTYTWQENVELCTQTQPLTLKNVAELPLEFVLRTALPFSVDTFEFLLQPGESATVNVTFDPGYRNDRQSHTAEGKLVAAYRNHPNRDSVPLLGEINFPNVKFDYTTIDFGTVLNDTTKTVSVKATNTSKIVTEISWTFEQDEEVERKRATLKAPFIPANQVFDILPIRSLLRPGESEIVEFAYYAHSQRKFKTSAVAIAKGGPEYHIDLLADSSTILHRIDAQFIDFGKVPYDVQDEAKEFNILNPGRVPFDFRIRLDDLSRPNVLSVVPMQGRIYAGEKQKVTATFRPGIPDRVMEHVKIDIAHFEPVTMPVYGHGIFTSILLSLPREDAESEAWTSADRKRQSGQ